MIKLIVFDLDDTLAPIGQGTTNETAKALHLLEERGIRLAISSGKPVFYLCGFCRQLGLSNPIMIGENGGIIHYGNDLPPKHVQRNELAENTQKKIQKLHELLQNQTLYNFWFQPNDVGLTCFFKNKEEADFLRAFFKKEVSEEDLLIVYEHADSFDITPQGIDKKTSLLRVMKTLDLQAAETAAVGNGVNDYPMFEAVGLSIAIGKHSEDTADYLVNDIAEALDLLLKKTL